MDYPQQQQIPIPMEPQQQFFQQVAQAQQANDMKKSFDIVKILNNRYYVAVFGALLVMIILFLFNPSFVQTKSSAQNQNSTVEKTAPSLVKISVFGAITALVIILQPLLSKLFIKQ